MIQECIEFLQTVLAHNNITVQADADTAKHQGGQWAAIEILDVKRLRDGSLVARSEDLETKARIYRRRTHRITLRTKVTIHSRRAAVLAETVATQLPRRIWDAGKNAILVNARGWEPEGDTSILRDRNKVELLIDFEGGAYKDCTTSLLDLGAALDLEMEIEMNSEGEEG